MDLINKTITIHYETLARAKSTVNFKKLKPEFAFENYYFITISIKKSFDINSWVVQEMINQREDALIVYDDALWHQLKTFTSKLYTGVSRESFDSIQTRLFKYDDPFTGHYESKGKYKVIILNALDVRFKSKLFLNTSRYFKDTELLLGFY